MENITDALQMAAFVLLFVLALSISINAFGEVRQATQIILDYKDREYDYTYVEENKTTKRIVGAETIIPSIYKAYKENYKIVFRDENKQGIKLYQKLAQTNDTIYQSICYIDLEQEVLGTDTQKERFIQTLLYGYSNQDDIKIFTDAGIKFDEDGIYNDMIKGQKFEETLGVYYQEEVQGQYNEPNANKTEKRVITYTKTNT